MLTTKYPCTAILSKQFFHTEEYIETKQTVFIMLSAETQFQIAVHEQLHLATLLHIN